MNHILVHYSGEIGVKGKNRPFFEKKLAKNIALALKEEKCEKVKRLLGRILITLKKGYDQEKITEKLKAISGIANFSYAYMPKLDIEEIKKSLLKLVEDKKSFRITAKNKSHDFEYNSQQLNEILGEFLIKKKNLKVNLSKPEITYYVETINGNSFVYTEKITGLGGLPVSSSGKLISLLSGGLDSPVAAYMLFKRGCSIVFVHFHNYTKDKAGVSSKVLELVKKLSKYQPFTKIYIIPFKDLQDEIIKAVPAEYRMIVYRRIMFMITEKILDKEEALGFVTGDSLGQVASQTLENLNVIYNKTDYPVITPLIGMSKQEIIKIAKDIGTYDISIQPYDDCCSYFVAKHPETKADLDIVLKFEASLKLEKLIEKVLKTADVKKIN